MEYKMSSRKINFRQSPMKIIMICFVFVAFVFGIYGIYKSSVLPVSKGYNASIENSSASLTVGEIVSSTEVTQTFTATENTYGFSLMFGTYSRQNEGTLHVALLDESNNQIVYEHEITLSSLVDNQFQDFIFESPLSNSSGNQYKIIVTSPMRDSTDDAVTIWTSSTDVYAKGICTINGEGVIGDLCFRVYDSGNGFISNAYWLFVGFIFISLALLTYIMLLGIWKTEYLFLASILCLGFVYLFLLTPHSIPDEQAHFLTAYRYSNDFMGLGHATASGGLFQRTDDAIVLNLFSPYPSINTYDLINKHLFELASNSTLVETAGYDIGMAPFVYWPAALGITIARLLGLGSVALYYFGRIANFLFFTFVTFFAVKKIPFGKNILIVVALLPMSLQQSMSFSYDAIVNGLALLFIAYCLYVAYDSKDLRVRDIIILCLLGILLAPAKAVYLGICFLCLLIPKERFSALKIRGNAKVKCMVAMLGCSLISFLVYNFTNVYNNFITADSTYLAYASSPAYTTSYFLAHPARLFSIIYNTLLNKSSLYYETMIGQHLAWQNIHLPSILIAAFVIVLVLSVFREEKEKTFLSDKGKGLIMLIICSVFALVCAVMLLGWTPISSNTVEGVQGRYFLPILPLVLLFFRNNRIVLKNSITNITIFSMWILQILTIEYAFLSII